MNENKQECVQLGPQSSTERRDSARRIRQQAAEIAFNRSLPQNLNNCEEDEYLGVDGSPNRIANFSKGLPHNNLGEVNPKAYNKLLDALRSGKPDDFEAIPLGRGRKLTSPQAGLAFDLEGPDAHILSISPAPRIDSSENSSEIAELYWMALLRDVNFTDFDNCGLANEAAENLSKFSIFKGPKDKNGSVTPATLFRGFTAGDLVGPYISQFLLKQVPYGTLTISQRQLTAVSGLDYMTDFKSWLEIQNGAPSSQDQFDSIRRYNRNLRDLATYVHLDALYEAYLNACLILLRMVERKEVRLNSGNPYQSSRTQMGFSTFGGPHILSLVTEVATRALKSVWFQKWFVHRRLRPEAFGGLVHNQLTGRANYPIDREILESQSLLQKIFDRNKELNIKLNRSNDGTFLLPQAFPEGSPTHPAYGAGHATVAGACVTILKAWFDESSIMPNAVVPNADGTALVAYKGDDKDALTVGGELNKIAANVAIGRNGAGVHWRSDYTESMKLGEAIAIGILEEQGLTYNEDHFFTLTKFDGTKIKISPRGVQGGQHMPVFRNQGIVTLKVTVENLAPPNGLFLSRFWFGLHDGSFDSFDLGERASLGIKRLAEDGDPKTLASEFSSSGAEVVQGTIFGPSDILGDIGPGTTVSLTFAFDGSLARNLYFSYATMVLPSNDAFIANEDRLAHQIFNNQGSFVGADLIVLGSEVLDAGTEVNDELPENAAGAAPPELFTPDTGVDENGIIHRHPGHIPGGNILSNPMFANADFTAPGYQIARITVSEVSVPQEGCILLSQYKQN